MWLKVYRYIGRCLRIFEHWNVHCSFECEEFSVVFPQTRKVAEKFGLHVICVILSLLRSAERREREKRERKERKKGEEEGEGED